MPIFLKHRRPELVERMDEADCDRQKLFNTYAKFRVINKLISRWAWVYRKKIRPLMQEKELNTFLDIGSGGGDISLMLAQSARRDGLRIHITAVDTDPRAMEYLKARNISDQDVDFSSTNALDFADDGKNFDFIISNHLLHHLNENQREVMLSACSKMVKKRVIFNDIQRSDVGPPLFGLFSAPLSINSFIREDGLTSIRKSFTRRELEIVCPPGWQVKSVFPFRLLLMYEPE